MNAPALVSREDAAAWFGVDLRTFERHVRRYLHPVRIGARVQYDPEEFPACRDRLKAGKSESDRDGVATASGSPSMGGRKNSGQGKKARPKQQQKGRASTRPLYLVTDEDRNPGTGRVRKWIPADLLKGAQRG